MERIAVLLGIFILGAMLFACAPKIMPASPGEGKLAEVAVPVAKSGWEAKWENILHEARKEGKVVLYAPPIAEVRMAFIETFQKSYPGISLEYTGMKGSDIAGKLEAERRAGLYIVDVYIGGTTTILTAIRESFQPIKPFLIRPDVLDAKAWLGGKLDFSDKAEELNIAFTTSATSLVAYNTELLKSDDITSFWDLTKPKFRGKIIYHDPRAAGKGLATATFWYLNSQLGLDYIKAFAANKPVLTRDHRLQAESVARGKYPVAVATDTVTREFISLGLPMNMTPLLKEGTYNTSGSGSVAILNRAPNPNAATVFLNWLLSQEGQTVWSVKSNMASRRLDVPVDHLHWSERLDIEAYLKGLYQDNYKEAIVMIKEEVVPYLREIFAGL